MQSIFNNLVTLVYYKGNQDNETGIFMAFSPEILDGQALANEMQGMQMASQPLMGSAVELPNAENLASSGAEAQAAELHQPEIGSDFGSLLNNSTLDM